jgi:hypothetical protein
MLLLGITAFSQDTQSREHQKPSLCGTDSFLNSLKQGNPEVRAKLEQMDKEVISYYKSSLNKGILTSTPTTITIPIVVYVVHNNGVENITDTQILSQINKLNTYFANYGFRFCLATMNNGATLPGGAANPGIIRIANASLADIDADTEHPSLTATSTLPSNRYLRIWVVKSINNGAADGYSILPDVVTPALDGVVMDYKAFGDLSTCGCTTLSPFSQTGKVLVHEVGHYLGLYHTFEGGCTGMNLNCENNGDKVCDTPPVSSANSGCSNINSCAESSNLPDDINNYMDYTNENCQNHFTEGQLTRMRAMITLYRSLLVSSANQTFTGVTCNGGLLASFTSNNNTPCVGSSVTFTASAVAGVTSYDWNFGDGNVGSGISVSHTYTSALNPAIVTLTITNGTNSASAIQSYNIEACVPLNNTESNWYFFNKNALSFSTGVPVYNNSAFINNTFNLGDSGITNESSAVQSNATGNLLFYTDGKILWNKNHQQVTNILKGNYSTLNGVVIVPNPGNSSQYYVFTNDITHGGTGPLVTFRRGLNYTKVQVDANNIATLVTGQVNVPVTLPPSVTGYETSFDGSGAIRMNEGITAVKKVNGYWIIASAVKNFNSLYFLIYELDAAGNLNFIRESFIENLASPVGNNTSRNVNIQVSPDAKKVAFSYGFIVFSNDYVYDFDICTGNFSNKRVIPLQDFYAMEFSPDSKLLYVTYAGKLTQIDLEGCMAMKEIVNIAPNEFGGMQRGPNNKIYSIIYATSQIAVINNPNNVSTNLNPNACNYNFNGPTMQNGTIANAGLPNMIDAKATPVFSNTILYNEARCSTACYTYNFEADTNTTVYAWNFGDPASGTANNTSSLRTPSHIFSAPGTYTVSCTTSSGTLTATVVVGAVPVITGNSEVCSQNDYIGSYGVVIPAGYSAHWSATGGAIAGLANQSNVIINWSASGGVITVVLTNNFNNCTSTASRTITIADLIPTVSHNTYCASSGDYSTIQSTIIPSGYTALWSIEYGILGTITTANNQATVGVTWPATFGYLGLTLTNPNGCTFKTIKTVYDQCACNCLNTYSFTYAQTSTKTATFYITNNSCGAGEVYYDYGDGMYGYSNTHTYAFGGTYTVIATPIIRGAYDEAICTGTPSTLQVTVTGKGLVDLGKQSLVSDIIISPNPASSVLNYKVALLQNGSFETVIRTVDGKELLRKKWNLGEGEHDLQLELPNNISDGMIFVELVSDEIKETRTVLIKK